MERKYTRLKLKLLLLVVAGTLAACAAGWLILNCVVDGLLQDPFARGFVRLAETLFGQSEEQALELYQTYVRSRKGAYINIAVILMMLCAFYLAMGKFTRWLNRIGAGVRQVVDETGEPVTLPGSLPPFQADLNSLQTPARREEEQAVRAAQKRPAGFSGPRSENAADLGDRLPDPSPGRPQLKPGAAGQIYRHCPGQGPAVGGSDAGVLRHHPGQPAPAPCPAP